MNWFFRTQLAWHVLRRERARLVVAILGIAFANLLILMQLGFKGALFYSCGRLHRSFQGDLCLVNPHFETLISPQSFSRDLLHRCQALPEVTRVQGVKVGLTAWRNPITGRTRNIQVVGFDPGFPILQDPEVAAQAQGLKSLGAVLFDRLGRPEFGPIEQLSQEQAHPVETELNRRRVYVSGLFSMGASFAADGCVLMSEDSFRMVFPETRRSDVEFGFLFLDAQGRQRITEVQASLQSLIGSAASVLTREELEKLEENYWANATGIGFIFSMGAVMGFVVGVVIVYQVLHSDVSDHLPQYATLKAMGYSNLFLLLTLAQESLILAVLGFGPGLALSMLLYQQAADATALPLFMTWDRALGVFAATVLMCTFSAAIASRRLLTADPAEIF